MNRNKRGVISRRHAELVSASSRYQYGFTLIELLVVVLIIGVLTAIAVPQYQKAVLKSRYSAMMPIGKAIADGNEVYYMEHGAYASLPTQLDVSRQNGENDDTNITLEADPEYLSYVRVANSDKVPNARYVVYQKHSANFADTTMCEAKGDTAKELCQRLGGVYVSDNGTEAHWVSYLLSGQLGAGSAFKEPCPENAVCNENDEVIGCNSGYYLYDNSCRVAHTSDYDYAGTSSCKSDFRIQYCERKTFGDNATCDGAGVITSGAGSGPSRCLGSTFSGESQCTNRAQCDSDSVFGTTTFTDHASCTDRAYCGHVVFNGKSSCDGGYCTHSSFADESSCIAGMCSGSVFSGNSTCINTSNDYYEGCSRNEVVSTFKDNAVCGGSGCDTANYEGKACCSSCSDGSGKPKCGTWSEASQSYDAW